MFFRILIPLIALSITPAFAKTGLRYVVYPVTGNTAQEIYASIKTQSPRIAPNATFAFTAPFFKTVKTEKTSSKGCGYKSFRTSTEFHVTLPNLAVKRAPPPALIKKWKSFVGYLAEHEKWHVDNWTACLKDYDAQAAALTARDCATLDAKREKLFTAIKLDCVAKDEAFDVNFRKDVLKHPFVKEAQKQN
jgi:predicted secreted Zn-dependent protease